MQKPIKLFYVSRCYRYERPQMGRYREFTQFGIEILGDKSGNDKQESIDLLAKCLQKFNVNFEMTLAVKRGLSYYVEDGFEISVDKLGAQKQICGGGRYKQGLGFAIGFDRLMLC